MDAFFFRTSEDRNEAVREIKEVIRQSMLEDSENFSKQKSSTSNILSTDSIHLSFPNELVCMRARSFSESTKARSNTLERHYSACEVDMLGMKRR